MRSLLLAAVLSAALAGCQTERAPEPQSPAAAPSAEPAADSALITVPLDEAGNRYVIDARSQSCVLVVVDGGAPVAAELDCARLAARVPEAAAHIDWLPASHAPDTATTPPAETPASQLAELVAAGVREVGKHRYEIDGAVIDAILANPTALVRSVRVVPALKDGVPQGFKLYAIRPGSIFATLGLKNGDTLRRVNGQDLSSPEQAIEAYSSLRGVDELELDLSRRGADVALRYRIVR